MSSIVFVAMSLKIKTLLINSYRSAWSFQCKYIFQSANIGLFVHTSEFPFVHIARSMWFLICAPMNYWLARIFICNMLPINVILIMLRFMKQSKWNIATDDVSWNGVQHQWSEKWRFNRNICKSRGVCCEHLPKNKMCPIQIPSHFRMAVWE